MENSETMQTPEMEQQESRRKEINDNLLNKYVVAHTKSIFPNTSFLMSILIPSVIILIGVLANVFLGINWPVIIAFCLVVAADGIYNLIIAIPFSRVYLTAMSSLDLQRILLDYKKKKLIGAAIFYLLTIAVLIWLAFEVRDCSVLRSEDIDVNKVVWFFLVISCLVPVGGIVDTYFETKKIDSIVWDIEERNYEKMISTLQM